MTTTTQNNCDFRKMHYLFPCGFNSCASQSNPSLRPFPTLASLSIIVHLRSRILGRSSASDNYKSMNGKLQTATALRAPRISCLFAKTNRHTFFSSSSYRLGICDIGYIQDRHQLCLRDGNSISICTIHDKNDGI